MPTWELALTNHTKMLKINNKNKHWAIQNWGQPETGLFVGQP
jgi:hypothetical protein